MSGKPSKPALCARLASRVTLEVHASGKIIACRDDTVVGLGAFSAAAADRVQDLRTGLPVAAFASGTRNIDKEMGLLVRRWAGHHMLEYPLTRQPDNVDQIVIEPQVADYWPGMARLGDSDVLVLSRFAYLRRRGNDMVLESPRSGALFRICNSATAAGIAQLSAPRQVKQLRRRDDFPGLEILALLVDCRMLCKSDAHGNLRSPEADDSFALWEFHDLMFHARSTEGRHANPLGGTYPHAGVMPPLPAVRPSWPGKKVDLRPLDAEPHAASRFAQLLHERHSIRTFDEARPITLSELSQILGSAARVVARWEDRVDLGDAGGGPLVAYAARPYPSAGAAYELELYLTVDRCEGLARGFYHYDAGEHALVAIGAGADELRALLTAAGF